jgi:hypothetical protein
MNEDYREKGDKWDCMIDVKDMELTSLFESKL